MFLFISESAIKRRELKRNTVMKATLTCTLLFAATVALAFPKWPDYPLDKWPESSYPDQIESSIDSTLFCDLSPAIDKSVLVQKQDMLERFLRYVAVESGSEESAYPITPGQIEMAELLKTDAEALGAKVVKSEWQYVYVDIPANIDQDCPVVGFTCHLDYTPEVPGKGIKPIVIKYNGGVIRFANGTTITPSEPGGEELSGLIGKTLIHSDGTTLLGGDDKNGCTILMSLIETLMNSNIKHGRVQFAFCPNEDVGHAADYIDQNYFNPDILFDVDSRGGCEIFDSNFTAKEFEVLFIGNSIHAQYAKEKKFGDALAAAATYIANIPVECRPERTDGVEGYIHPYYIEAKEKGSQYLVKSRIRYFDKVEGDLLYRLVRESLKKANQDFPYVKTEILRDEILYDNVENTMHPDSRSVLDRAAARSRIKIKYQSKRAGSTASLLVVKGMKGGLSIFSGQHNVHSKQEYSCLEEMMDSYCLLLHAIEEVANLE